MLPHQQPNNNQTSSKQLHGVCFNVFVCRLSSAHEQTRGDPSMASDYTKLKKAMKKAKTRTTDSELFTEKNRTVVEK